MTKRSASKDKSNRAKCTQTTRQPKPMTMNRVTMLPDLSTPTKRKCWASGRRWHLHVQNCLEWSWFKLSLHVGVLTTKRLWTDRDILEGNYDADWKNQPTPNTQNHAEVCEFKLNRQVSTRTLRTIVTVRDDLQLNYVKRYGQQRESPR